MDQNEALRDIQTIKSVAAGLSRKRDAVYVLMTEIYRIGLRWRKSGQPRELRDYLMQQEKLRVDRRARKTIFRFLIEVAYPVDRRLRSRYANALNYARMHNCSSTDLTEFLKSRGGIEKCAKRFVALRRKSQLEAKNRTTTKLGNRSS